jgi:hypothetical protein
MEFSNNGEQIIFPVQRQQRNVKTAGWGNFAYDLGLSEIFCAIWERYKSVNQPIPTFSVTIPTGTFETDQTVESYKELLSQLSKVGIISYWDDLIQQVHDAVRSLGDYYVTSNNGELDDEFFESNGILPEGAKYPDSIDGVRKTLRKLIYTRSDPYSIAHSFNFSEWSMSGGGYTDGYVYAPYVLPRTDEYGRDTGSWRIAEADSLLGEPSIGTYQSLHRLLSHYLVDKRSTCPRFFYAPCNGFQKVVPSTQGSTIGDDLPLSPITVDDVTAITQETNYSFNVDTLIPHYNYFLTGTCSIPQLKSDQLGKYAVRANSIYLNDCLLPQYPQHPWEVTSLLKCGVNTIKIVHYGDYKWTSIYLVPMVPVNPSMGWAAGYESFALNGTCFERVKYAHWIYPDHKSLESLSFSLDFAKSAEDPTDPFKCVVGSGGIQFSQPPTVEGVPKAPRSLQVVSVEFTAPNDAETYRADLVYYPLTLDRRLKRTDAESVDLGPTQRVDILQSGSTGPLGSVSTFQFETPADLVWEWVVRITFDTGSIIECVLPNQGIFVGDGEKRYVEGGVEHGTTGMCFDGSTTAYPSCSLEPIFI